MDFLSRLLSAPTRLLPERLPRVFLYAAFVASFVLLVFYDSRYSQVTYPVGWRTSFLNSLTYLIDPLLLHFLGLILYGYLRWRYLALYHPEERASVRFVLSLGAPLLLLVVSFALEHTVLKPAFRYPRPGQQLQPLGEPWLTTWIRAVGRLVLTPLTRLLPIAFSQPGSGMQDVPSGFALRQLILFYLTVWIAEQPKQSRDGKVWLTGRGRGIVHVLNSVALVFVIFSRVYRANHTFFAMTVAAGVATFLFWSFLAVLYSFSPKHRERYRSLLSETFAAYLAFAVAFFAYANDVGRWLIFSVVILIMLTTAYMFTRPAMEPSEECKEWDRSD